jgi:hypothetical protein
MAKGQMKGNKEAKKPKADKDAKGKASAYKASQESGISVTTETFKKKK